MFGEACYGEVPFATALAPVGVPIIPEVVFTTTELVMVVEIDLILLPHQSRLAQALGMTLDNTNATLDSDIFTMDQT